MEIYQHKMTLDEFNRRGAEKAKEDLFKCCGSTAWLDDLMQHFPFPSTEDLKICSDRSWFSRSKTDWLEAFSHHPKIGDNENEIKNFTSTKEWAGQEQAGVRDAGQPVLDELRALNVEYQKKFGYIFIVCATGKSADEMLEILKNRLNNDPEKELHIAAIEQNKITHLRIDKIFA